MTHYICAGNCKGVATEEGVCKAIECSKYGQALTPCDCPDGYHNNLQGESQSS